MTIFWYTDVNAESVLLSNIQDNITKYPILPGKRSVSIISKCVGQNIENILNKENSHSVL